MKYLQPGRYLITAMLLITVMADHMSAQDATIEWGPGEIGECVDTSQLPLWPRSYSKHHYYLFQNSLYRIRTGDDCGTKVVDFPSPAFCIDERNCSLTAITVVCEDGLYHYDTGTGFLSHSTLYDLLGPFLARPVISVKARSGSWGCFGGMEEDIDHAIIPVEQPLPSLRYEEPLPQRKKKLTGDGVDVGELTRLLRHINMNPHELPSLADFRLQDDDIERYVDLAKKAAEDTAEVVSRELFYDGDYEPNFRNSRDYLRLVSAFDTISAGIVVAALDMRENQYVWSGTDFDYVTIVNDAGDTIEFIHRTSGPDTPYNLPWVLKVDSVELEIYNIDLARMLTDLLPKKPWPGISDQESRLLMLNCVAGYLERLKRQNDGSVITPEKE